jgi:hypothetical protein
MLSNKEIIEIIQDYIKDDIYKSAILINGKWGSGKTFFIKEELFKVITNDRKYDEKNIYISLYGLENIKEISNRLYSELCSETLVKISGVEKESINKGIKLIPKMVSSLSKFIPIPFIKDLDSFQEILRPLIEEIVKIKKCIIVFDDLERCKIDISELFGYINELVEHNQVKVILVANEDKIQIKSKYNEIKEKLIGLTIKYKPEFNSIYEKIIDTYLKENELKKYLKKEEQKSLVLKEFNDKEYYNLRTLIHLITAYKKIFSLLKSIKFDKKYLETHLNNTLIYSAYILLELKIKNKLENLDFFENNEMGSVFLKDNSQKVLYGYKFINDYFQTGYLNKEKIKRILLDEMRERKEIDERTKESESLSFNSLFNKWCYLEDEVINNKLELLKDELKENKYPPMYYKNIVILLWQLKSNDFLSTYNIDILEYIELMEDNLKAEETKRKYEKNYKHEIFKILTDSTEIEKEYNNLTKGFIKIIDDFNEENFKQQGSSFIAGNVWNKEFINKCFTYADAFLVNKKFLFNEDIEKLRERLMRVKSPFDIYCLIEGINKVYNFSNVDKYYKDDIPNLNLLINCIKEIISEVSKKSITKKLALENLQEKLEEYLSRIKS